MKHVFFFCSVTLFFSIEQLQNRSGIELASQWLTGSARGFAATKSQPATVGKDRGAEGSTVTDCACADITQAQRRRGGD